MSKSKQQIKELQEEKRKAKLLVNALGLHDLAGKFWFSRQQRKDLDRAGRHRTFAKLYDGMTVEYTQMVDFETLAENPFDCCHYIDAMYLGEGTFSHFEEQ